MASSVEWGLLAQGVDRDGRQGCRWNHYMGGSVGKYPLLHGGVGGGSFEDRITVCGGEMEGSQVLARD